MNRVEEKVFDPPLEDLPLPFFAPPPALLLLLFGLPDLVPLPGLGATPFGDGLFGFGTTLPPLFSSVIPLVATLGIFSAGSVSVSVRTLHYLHLYYLHSSYRISRMA